MLSRSQNLRGLPQWRAGRERGKRECRAGRFASTGFASRILSPNRRLSRHRNGGAGNGTRAQPELPRRATCAPEVWTLTSPARKFWAGSSRSTGARGRGKARASCAGCGRTASPARAGVSERARPDEEQLEAPLIAVVGKEQKPIFPAGDVERTAAVFAALSDARGPLDATTLPSVRALKVSLPLLAFSLPSPVLPRPSWPHLHCRRPGLCASPGRDPLFPARTVRWRRQLEIEETRCLIN